MIYLLPQAASRTPHTEDLYAKTQFGGGFVLGPALIGGTGVPEYIAWQFMLLRNYRSPTAMIAENVSIEDVYSPCILHAFLNKKKGAVRTCSTGEGFLSVSNKSWPTAFVLGSQLPWFSYGKDGHQPYSRAHLGLLILRKTLQCTNPSEIDELDPWAYASDP